MNIYIDPLTSISSSVSAWPETAHQVGFSGACRRACGAIPPNRLLLFGFRAVVRSSVVTITGVVGSPGYACVVLVFLRTGPSLRPRPARGRWRGWPPRWRCCPRGFNSTVEACALERCLSPVRKMSKQPRSFRAVTELRFTRKASTHKRATMRTHDMRNRPDTPSLRLPVRREE
jgi:hypothetical protein